MAEQKEKLRLKICLNNEIRVFNHSFDDMKDAYKKLNDFITNKYQLKLDDIWLQYTDNEDDTITISSENDIEDALSFNKDRNKCCKLYIKYKQNRNEDKNDSDINMAALEGLNAANVFIADLELFLNNIITKFKDRDTELINFNDELKVFRNSGERKLLKTLSELIGCMNEYNKGSNTDRNMENNNNNNNNENNIENNDINSVIEGSGISTRRSNMIKLLKTLIDLEMKNINTYRKLIKTTINWDNNVKFSQPNVFAKAGINLLQFGEMNQRYKILTSKYKNKKRKNSQIYSSNDDMNPRSSKKRKTK